LYDDNDDYYYYHHQQHRQNYSYSQIRHALQGCTVLSGEKSCVEITVKRPDSVYIYWTIRGEPVVINYLWQLRPSHLYVEKSSLCQFID